MAGATLSKIIALSPLFLYWSEMPISSRSTVSLCLSACRMCRKPKGKSFPLHFCSAFESEGMLIPKATTWSLSSRMIETKSVLRFGTN